MDGVQVKQELIEHLRASESQNRNKQGGHLGPLSLINLSSSSSDSDSDSSSSSSSSSANDDGGVLGENGKRPRVSNKKKKKMEALAVALPLGFLDPLPLATAPLPSPPPLAVSGYGNGKVSGNVESCKQFWKAGDYEGGPQADWYTSSGGMDHVRIHPRFLHSNATSHKWALGAFAELLDNAVDEVCNGATFVNVDMRTNRKDGGRMLMIEDNGGGMDPDKMRQCMSLGYSEKSKVPNTIGQYGNGFKTSTMRLGADVIVFSRCCAKDGKRPTQSIGLLSYTFLRSTGKEDIVVPMLDYERGGQKWNKMTRFSASDWNRNLETMVQWSPFSSEADMLQQFNRMGDHGTRIIIYNLWENDQGQLELDFDSDPHDIQIRGVNRDENNIQMAKQFPNSKHFLTYRHSLRSYASILYLRLPPAFRIILCRKDVEHHNIEDDLMMTQKITYRPQTGTDGVPMGSNIVVTIGFVKDAAAHIDVQGFNVYHKNRLVKPFWRIWNACGSDGRGVIGVLEANFVEPAHDKQGFERTTVLSRLEDRLKRMQRTFWTTYCYKIGYSQRRTKQHMDDGDISPEYRPRTSPLSKRKNTSSNSKIPISGSGKPPSPLNPKHGGRQSERYGKMVDKNYGNGHLYTPVKLGDNISGNECPRSNINSLVLDQFKEENKLLRERLKRKEEEVCGDLQHNLQHEKERCKSVETKIEVATQKIEALNKERDALVAIFSEERERRDIEEEHLRKKLKDASNTMQELLDKVRQLEKM